MELRILTRRRVFLPHSPFLCHSTSVRLWEKRSRLHNNNSKQQQSQPYIYIRRDRHRRSGWPIAVLHRFPSRLLACQRSF